MTSEFQTYAKAALAHAGRSDEALVALPATLAWWTKEGRDRFATALKAETTLSVGTWNDPGQVIAAAIPKTWRDLEAKAKTAPYYRAHAQWFTEEMNLIATHTPSGAAFAADTLAYENVWHFTQRLLRDSVWLFEVHGAEKLEVPGVYGIYANREQHLVGFFHGARQIIYGHGAWGLSFLDNHSDIAVSIVRQAIELRIRRALGVTAKINRLDGGFEPLALSRLLAVIDTHKNAIQMPIGFEHIVRLKHWADLYLHEGVRDFAWAPARAIAFLRPFLVGGAAPHGLSVDAGFQIKRAAFDEMRAELKKDNEDELYELPLWPSDQCAVVFI